MRGAEQRPNLIRVDLAGEGNAALEPVRANLRAALVEQWAPADESATESVPAIAKNRQRLDEHVVRVHWLLPPRANDMGDCVSWRVIGQRESFHLDA